MPEAEIQRVNIPENGNITQKPTLSFRLQRKVIKPRGHILYESKKYGEIPTAFTIRLPAQVIRRLNVLRPSLQLPLRVCDWTRQQGPIVGPKTLNPTIS